MFRVITLSDFLKDYGVLLVIISIILLIVLFRYYKTDSGRVILDKVFLKLPIIGEFLKTMYLARLAESLSTLISGGLMITSALDLSSDIVGNTQYKKAMTSARDEVRRGVPVSSVLALYPEIFPPVFIQMTLVGEKTGSLDTRLINIYGFYQREVERGIENILSILEPVLIIGLGGIVGGLMLSILMPLYQLMTL
jgi:type IV pilus assembly protein PilC